MKLTADDFMTGAPMPPMMDLPADTYSAEDVRAFALAYARRAVALNRPKRPSDEMLTDLWRRGMSADCEHLEYARAIFNTMGV
jgi:hypothetical protein